MQDQLPVGLHHKRGDDIGKEKEREPFQDHYDLIITAPDRGPGDADSEEQH